MREINIEKYDFIDSLRGFAILGVVLRHSAEWVNPRTSFFWDLAEQGARGVQLFFITSALALFLSMEQRFPRESRPFMGFYIRRFFRIAPLFYLGILAYSLYFGLGPRTWAPAGVEWWFIPLTAAFLHGWNPMTINSVVPGGWAIAIEMTFYVVAPFLFFRLRNIKTTFVALAGSLALAVVLSSAVLSVYYPVYPEYSSLVRSLAFSWFFSQLPVFLMGVLLYQVIRKHPAPGNRRLGIFLALAALLLFVALIRVPPIGDFVIQHYLYGVAFCIFIFSLFLYPMKIFVNPATKMIGKLSFGIYLAHSGVLFALGHIFPDGFPEQGNTGCALVFLVVFAVAVSISFLTYHLIEQPGRRIGKRVIEKL